ncbi:NHLP leader peptide family RiPP precursor [Nostoc sp. CHAB 5834]|nr:NHLP leader peptide family RiPP precursor [Nostoc sp. CHAB 5834]
MEIAKMQELNAQIVQKAWEDTQFKSELIANPVETMESFTGNKINLPKGQKLVVQDQTDETTVYFNIPRKVELDTLELTDEQLEMVAGGESLLLIAGLTIGVAIWAATHQH